MVAAAVDVSTRPDLITRWHVTTVPWFVFNQVHSFAGPLPELVLTQRLQDLAGTSPEGESSH